MLKTKQPSLGVLINSHLRFSVEAFTDLFPVR